MEPRCLAAPLLIRSFGFTGFLEAGSQSVALGRDDTKGLGEGQGLDDTYAANARAFSAIFAEVQDPNDPAVIRYRWDESSSVTNTVAGPGSGWPGDPNPGASTQIQVNVAHTATDTVANNTQFPVNQGIWLETGESSRATSGDGAFGRNNLGFVTTQTGGNATLTFTFQVTLSRTGDDKFDTGASLVLDSPFLHVDMDPNIGLVVRDDNHVVLDDPNFQAGAPFSHTHTVTVVVGQVGDNTPVDISYDSSLASGPGLQSSFDPGVATNNSNFNWSLKVEVS